MKWFFVAWFLVDALTYVAIVGKPRKPISAATATGAVIINAALIALVLAFWGN